MIQKHQVYFKNQLKELIKYVTGNIVHTNKNEKTE